MGICVKNTKCSDKKSLKIPKGSSETVNQRRTDNTDQKRRKGK